MEMLESNLLKASEQKELLQEAFSLFIWLSKCCFTKGIIAYYYEIVNLFTVKSTLSYSNPFWGYLNRVWQLN